MHLPPPTFDFGTWWGACPERKPKDRFFARLASESFLSSLLVSRLRRSWNKSAPSVVIAAKAVIQFSVYSWIPPRASNRQLGRNDSESDGVMEHYI
jgi:hypothetical protein